MAGAVICFQSNLAPLSWCVLHIQQDSAEWCGEGAPTFAPYLESVLLGFGGQNPKTAKEHQKRREMGHLRQQHPVLGHVFCFNFMGLEGRKEEKLVPQEVWTERGREG